MPRHESVQYVVDMLDYAREAEQLCQGRCRSDLEMDRLFNLGMIRLLEVIGEAASHVPDNFRGSHPAVPWRDLTDLRNRLIHG